MRNSRFHRNGYYIGPSDGIRTHGLLVPNQARYQLRYARMYLVIIATAAGFVKEPP